MRPIVVFHYSLREIINVHLSVLGKASLQLLIKSAVKKVSNVITVRKCKRYCYYLRITTCCCEGDLGGYLVTIIAFTRALPRLIPRPLLPAEAFRI